MSRLRLAFAGTPAFAAVALEHLRRAGHEIAVVLTQPDRPAGRGMKFAPSPVKQAAEQAGIKLVQARSLRLDGRHPDDARAAQQALQSAQPDAMVVAAYGLILPLWALALPRLGCLNIHASLLPRWRGAAPIQRAIEAGDARTGITIMQMDAGLDTGDLLLSEATPIDAHDTSGSLHERLAALGGRLIVEALGSASVGGLQPRPQAGEGVTYATKIDKSEAAIDWRRPAIEIERRLRAFDPQPGCHAQIDGVSVKLWRAKVSAGFEAEPGSVIRSDGGLVVACGQDALSVLELQRPGGRRLPIAAYLAAA